ncbi:MAG: YbaB/EbfC family nucleoid-associated protein [Mycoplasmataceae bacterium]|nr:YbaB/EbfC family nucleoid-associated protein [Mycoplasmataceae bacterium]
MNMNAMMAQAKKMQAEMEASKALVEKQEFKIEKQGVTVILSGKRRVKTINVNDALIDIEDKDILEDLIVIAINEGLEQIEEAFDATTPSTPGMPF